MFSFSPSLLPTPVPFQLGCLFACFVVCFFFLLMGQTSLACCSKVFCVAVTMRFSSQVPTCSRGTRAHSSPPCLWFCLAVSPVIFHRPILADFGAHHVALGRCDQSPSLWYRDGLCDSTGRRGICSLVKLPDQPAPISYAHPIKTLYPRKGIESP